jgi:plasmid stabilization system protein ParE
MSLDSHAIHRHQSQAAVDRIGRKVGANLRELVISQGRSGYLALYRYDEEFDVVLLLRVRHQREAGYRE